MSDHSTIQFEELADQFANQIRQGQNPDLSEFAERYPAWEDKIRQLFPVLQMLEQNGHPVSDLTESGIIAAELEASKDVVPTSLGEYRIVREIGRGGMGIVYEAHHESLNRRVALKLLPDSATFDQRRRSRFHQEAMASARLHHTNIVPVFGIGKHEETSYFVMQFIEGAPLNQVLSELSKSRSNPRDKSMDSTSVVGHAMASTIASNLDSLSEHSSNESNSSAATNIDDSQAQMELASSINSDFWTRLTDIGLQVSSALEHAHAKQILHRDIKPSNLMLDKDGNAWITDFGLAKLFESPDLTKTGEVIGTLRYMSPEQLNGKSEARSDIFSLGLTLYELAYLKPAYDAKERGLLIKQVVNATPKRLRLVEKRTPRDLATIIEKCIEANPDRRYQTPAELHADLRRFRDGEPIQAREIGPLERLTKWCKRQPVIASLLTALLISMVAGIVGISLQWRETDAALTLANENLEEAKKQTKLANEKTKLANEQTEVAQEHFLDLRKTVNKFFTVISQQRLLMEPGFQSLRRELMEEALKYHKQFVEQYSDDDHLKYELAQSLYAIADIQGTVQADIDGAQEWIVEAKDILTKLYEDHPETTKYGTLLGKTMMLEGTLIRRKDTKRAFDIAHQVVEHFETLRENNDDDEGQVLFQLGQNYQMLGLAYDSFEMAGQQESKALEYFQKALTCFAELNETHANYIPYIVALADIHRDLGYTNRRLGNYELTASHYDEALALLSPVVDEFPNDVVARRAYGSIANTIAYFYSKGTGEDDLETGLELFQTSQKQYEILSDQYPLIFEYKDGMARAALGAGAILQVQGHLAKALELRQYAASVREKLCELNPKAFFLFSSWAVSLNGVGATLRDLGMLDEALKNHELAHIQHCRAVELDPAQPVFRMRLMSGLAQSARVFCEQENFEKAMVAVDMFDDYSLDHFSKPYFDKGNEFTFIACKIGKLETPTPEQIEMKNACIQRAQKAYEIAVERGYDVPRLIGKDQGIRGFSKYEECQQILDWIEEKYGEK